MFRPRVCPDTDFVSSPIPAEVRPAALGGAATAAPAFEWRGHLYAVVAGHKAATTEEAQQACQTIGDWGAPSGYHSLQSGRLLELDGGRDEQDLVAWALVAAGMDSEFFYIVGMKRKQRVLKGYHKKLSVLGMGSMYVPRTVPFG